MKYLVGLCWKLLQLAAFGTVVWAALEANERDVAGLFLFLILLILLFDNPARD